MENFNHFSNSVLKTLIYYKEEDSIKGGKLSHISSRELEHISRVLAVLIAENKEYAYVDKLAYVVSPDLAIYYLREALRDFNSLIDKGSWENREAQGEAEKINMEYVEKTIQQIAYIDDPKEIRRIVSTIAAKALARANKLRKPVEKREEKKESEE